MHRANTAYPEVRKRHEIKIDFRIVLVHDLDECVHIAERTAYAERFMDATVKITGSTRTGLAAAARHQGQHTDNRQQYTRNLLFLHRSGLFLL